MGLLEQGARQAAGQQGGARVLIAEDEPAVAALPALIVEESGYVPLGARNGAQAPELGRGRHPALLITGLLIPVLGGAGLIAALRDADAAVPAIVVTAMPRHVAAAGADAVLAQPVEIGQLEALFARFLPL